jgi:acetyltransferase-like isoleucine patch superfamily enzyme
MSAAEKLSSWVSKFYERLVQRLLERKIGKIGYTARRFLYPPILKKMGRSVKIRADVELVNPSGIILDDYVQLGRGVRITNAGQGSLINLRRRVILDRGVDIRAHRAGSCIEIGERTYIGPYTCLSGNHIKIGNDCLVASHSSIYANNHNYKDPSQKIKTQGHKYIGIIVEEDCWLGTGVRITDGVTIGQGSVVGAGAVVTKNIPPYSIAVGVPAKVIGHRQKDENILEEVKNL